MTNNLLNSNELDILRLVAAGYTREEIAERMCMSRRTVEWYKGRIMRAFRREGFRARNTVETINAARMKGILS